MAEKIKKFFARKKADAKFKLAGPAYRLNEASSTSIVAPQTKKTTYVAPRSQPSEVTRQAAEAALARINARKNNSNFNTSLAAIQAKVRKELEAEALLEKKETAFVPQSKPEETELEASPHLAVKGVFFRCPLISEEVLSKEEWKDKIKNFLFEQLDEERELTACLIIHSCNFSRTKVTECVNVLCRYLDNIIGNPTETKFHKIRCSNATYVDKVAPVLGASELLFAAGFRKEVLDHNGSPEEFWVFNEANIKDIQTLETIRETLMTGDRVELEIDRNVQVLSPAQASTRVELPKDFYNLSAEELKREQQTKTEIMEKQMQLRTKAMREKDELREIKKYRFALIRIRFPDGLYLQGTFSVYETFSAVVDFVQDNLEHSLPFILTSPTGQRFEEGDLEESLVNLRLVPATILIFMWHPSVEEDVKLAGVNSYLKPEVMMMVQSL